MKPPTVDYAEPRRRKESLTILDVAIVLLTLIAFAAGGLTFVDAMRTPLTNSRKQYEVARVTAQATRPSYVQPPFIGKTYGDPSPWKLAAAGTEVALAAMGVVAIVLRVQISKNRPLYDR